MTLFRNWHFSTELCTLYAEERFDIAHVRVLGKQLLTEGEVGRHVGRCDDQNEVWARRYTPALLHPGLGNGFVLELQQGRAVLPVQ